MPEFKIDWHDAGLEPQSPPNPEYPNGIDVAPFGPDESCRAELPYPAKRIGLYYIKCLKCGANMVATTAGRPDDPRSVTVRCKGRS